jgi:hypothetical protein
MLKIEGFPHAQYDSETKTGFLSYYYPTSAIRDGILSMENWRNESYSPEILNYKEGRDDHIRWFVRPFLELVRHALRESNFSNAYLVSVPSSIATNDPQFSSVPRKKGGPRNRDNRNAVFCDFLSQADSSLAAANVLIRTTSKAEKLTWTPDLYATSMAVTAPRLSNASAAMVLIDDVRTDGGTLQGAKVVLGQSYPGAYIICLTIGLTRSPHQFVPLSQPDQ